VTVKQRVILVIAAAALLAVVLLFLWILQKPEESPKGVLVYKEAYMRIADRPWQGERLCHNK